LHSLLLTPVKEYPQFAAGLSFLGHLMPQDTLDLLKERSEALVKQIQEIRSSMEAILTMGIDRLFVIEMEYSLAMLVAEPNWLGELIKDIENGVITERKEENLVWIVNYKEPSQGDRGYEISKNNRV
jgi:hypothetical protein